MRRFMTFLILSTLASLFYVSQEVGAVQVGYTIRKQEETRTLLLDRTRALQYNIERLKSPNNLERRLTAQKIILQSPKSWQTLVMTPGQAKPAHTSVASFLTKPPIFSKLLMGTAQAEAKES